MLGLRSIPALPFVAAVATLAHAAAGQSFTLVGLAPGASSSRVTGLSSDGRSASGFSGQFPSASPFHWSTDSGRYDLAGEVGVPTLAGANAISGDGVTIAGDSSGNRGQSYSAFRWSGPGTFATIAPQSGYVNSTAAGVSGDGGVIVGSSYNTFQGATTSSQAFRWTASGGLQPLGFTRPGSGISRALGISRDGSTIVGGGEMGLTFDAFKWTASGGMEVLPPLPGALPNSNYARAANADGSIVVGNSGQRAAYWRAGVVLDLGIASGFGTSTAIAVSDDGLSVLTFLGGLSSAESGLWTPQGGMRRLADHLASHGVTVPGNATLQALAMSSDATTFGGLVTIPGQGTQGFVATIPSPGASLALAVLMLSHARRRRFHALTGTM